MRHARITVRIALVLLALVAAALPAQTTTVLKAGGYDAADKAVAKLEQQYSALLAKPAVKSLKPDPWESDAEFTTRRDGALIADKDYLSWQTALAGLEGTSWVLEKDAITLTDAGYDRNTKLWTFKASTKSVNLPLTATVKVDLSQTSDLASAWKRLDAAIKSKAIGGRAVFTLSRKPDGKGWELTLRQVTVFQVAADKTTPTLAQAYPDFRWDYTLSGGKVKLKVQESQAKAVEIAWYSDKYKEFEVVINQVAGVLTTFSGEIHRATSAKEAAEAIDRWVDVMGPVQKQYRAFQQQFPEAESETPPNELRTAMSALQQASSLLNDVSSVIEPWLESPELKAALERVSSMGE